jgi:two-component sensor histidine kinase
MTGRALQVRVFIIVAAALTLAMVMAALQFSDGMLMVVVLAWLACLGASWMTLRSWFTSAARGTGTLTNAPTVETPTYGLRGADLVQRDYLIREIHHRVRNNLQMISSLLSLQADRIRSPRIRKVFSGAQNRVLTMAVLHRHLYERTNWAQVDLQAFLNDLVRHLSTDHRTRGPSGVRIDVNAANVTVGPDVAVPVGLIVTEAVSNALTHGLKNVTDPQILIRAREIGGAFELLVEDNGDGIDTGQVTPGERDGLGFTLLRGLAAQLSGTLSVTPRPEGGTQVMIRFPAVPGNEAGKERQDSESSPAPT